MICKSCRGRHLPDNPPLRDIVIVNHTACPGGSWCDCQHVSAPPGALALSRQVPPRLHWISSTRGLITFRSRPSLIWRGLITTGRLHGRNGMVYMAIGGIGNSLGLSSTAQPLAFISDWTMNFTVAKVDVTALGDTNLVWVAGLPDASGDFTGFMDTATSQTYQSAVDGQPRNFYLYPTLVAVNGGPGNATVSPGQYFFGTILPDYSAAGGVAAAVTMKSTWNAASQVARYPANGVPGT